MFDTVLFAGTGTLLMYSMGIAKRLRERLGDYQPRVITVSGGGVAGVALLTLRADQFDSVASRLSSVLGELKGHPFGNFLLSSNYKRALQILVTPSALSRLRGKLAVATTSLLTGRQRLYDSNFTDVDTVVRDLQASAYIPFYFLRPPYYQHFLEIDGGASSTIYDPATTLVVGAGYSPSANVSMSEDSPRVSSLAFRSYDEHMALYFAGYQRALEVLG